jgi:uncharacterized protein (TIGR03437 family)
MFPSIRFASLLFLAVVPAYGANPTITAVVNGSSFDARLTAGEPASMFGANLGTTGTTVTVGGQNATVLSANSGQVNFQIPPSAPLGSANVIVTVAGTGSSAPFSITVVSYAPAFLHANNSGSGPITAVHPGGVLVSATTPAVPYEIVSIYLAGLGPTNPAQPVGVTPGTPLYNSITTPVVRVNSEISQVLFSGLAPGFIGFYQINLRIPADAISGLLPISVSTGGGTTDPGTLYVSSDQYKIGTVAGQIAPVNVSASNSFLTSPGSLTIDQNGNLLIADQTSRRIRKVVLSTGIVSAVAGNGSAAGDSGDGGAALNAGVYAPSFLAVDTSGNMFISERNTCVVRKVDHATLKISTYAGTAGVCGYSGDNGPVASAKLNSNRGIAFDPSGNLYIADASNNVVRKVSTAGTITTFAGTGTSGYSGDGGAATLAMLSGLRDVATDAVGNVYITANGRIRRVDNTGTISTYAGTGNASPYNDGQSAVSTNLSQIIGLVCDAAGNLYFNDAGFNRVRKLDHTALTISTIAGNGTTGNSGDNGPATSASFLSLRGIAVDNTTNVYVADYSANTVRKITPGAVGTITTYAGSLGPDSVAPASAFLTGPVGLAFDGAGEMFVGEYNARRVRKVDTAFTNLNSVAGTTLTGNTGDNGPALTATFQAISGMAADSSGNYFVADPAACVVRKVTGTTISTVAGTGTCGYSNDGQLATTAQIGSPAGLAIDTFGTLYIADSFNNRVRAVSGGIITTIAGTGTAGFSPDGTPANTAQVSNPNDVKVAPNGDIYLADTGNQRIRVIRAADGQIYTVAGVGTAGYSGDGASALAAKLNSPVSITLDLTGNVFIGDLVNLAIRKVNAASGIINTVAGSGTGGYSGDGGLATLAKLNGGGFLTTDPAGRVLFAEPTNGVVRRLTPRYVLTTSANPSTGGTVAPGSGLLDAGSTAILVAVPNPGFTFVGFSGSISTTGNNVSLTMDGTKFIVANFVAQNPSISGTVTARLNGVGTNERDYTLKLSNTGTGPATNCQVSGVTIKGQLGTGGTPTLLSTLPISFGSVPIGGSASQQIRVTVAPTLLLLNISVSGSCTNALNVPVAFSAIVTTVR